MTEEIEAPEKKPGISVKSFVDADQAQRDVQISQSDVSSSFVDQAALFLHYGNLATRAAAQVDRMKQLLKLAEAQVDKQIRDAAAEESKKLTEAMIDKEILRHPKIVQVTKALNEAKMQERLADVAVEGMRHRRDMLIQIGAHTRVEMQGEQRLTVSQAKRDEEKDQRERVAAMRAKSAAE